MSCDDENRSQEELERQHLEHVQKLRGQMSNHVPILSVVKEKCGSVVFGNLKTLLERLEALEEGDPGKAEEEAKALTEQLRLAEEQFQTTKAQMEHKLANMADKVIAWEEAAADCFLKCIGAEVQRPADVLCLRAIGRQAQELRDQAQFSGNVFTALSKIAEGSVSRVRVLKAMKHLKKALGQ